MLSCVNRSLRGGLWGVFFALNAALLGSCGVIPQSPEPQTSPTVTDNIRNQDLLPRFPQRVDPNGQNAAASANPQVYTGDVVSPIERAQPQPQPQLQPTANGQGYELNFENTPVASIAKVVLGDI